LAPRATSCEITTAPRPSPAGYSGAIYDLTGSYRAAFLNGIALHLLNMSIALWLLLGRLRPRPAPA
jgi:hypothetical protein